MKIKHCKQCGTSLRNKNSETPIRRDGILFWDRGFGKSKVYCNYCCSALVFVNEHKSWRAKVGMSKLTQEEERILFEIYKDWKSLDYSIKSQRMNFIPLYLPKRRPYCLGGRP